MSTLKVSPCRSFALAIFTLTVGLMIATNAGAGDSPVATPTAVIETEPVPSKGDAADDPAIWVHPTKPERSLVLGTDKKGGLNVFNLEGRRTQIVSDGSRPNNVDVIYGFPLGGRVVDLAVAGTRIKAHPGIAVWQIDPENGRLTELGPIPAFTVFGGGEPYGTCIYKSPRDRAIYLFVTSKDGDVEQYRLETVGNTAIRGKKVRSFKLSSTTEGCVADFDLGNLYLAEEKVGIWKYGAEPDSGSSSTLVARVGDHGLTADVEGLTIYYGSGSKGYLIASSQKAGTFQLYERVSPNALVLTLDPAAGTISDIGDCDGIDVTSAAITPRFPHGLFVCQDGRARGGQQNFKFFAWDQIAGNRLIVDTTRAVRGR